jgi:tetratricopeptide (TPR) repeat protein
MKISKRLAEWVEAGARTCMAHWLLIVGSLLVLASAALKWMYFAFSRHPSGLELPLLRKMELVPHFSVLSYGVVGIAVLVIALVLLWRSAAYLALCAVAILIAMWFAAPCRLAFSQPSLLRRLTTETQEISVIRNFTKTYLPTDFGRTEKYDKFDIETLWDRFVAAFSFLGLGWYCFGVGSLLIAVYVTAWLRPEEKVRAPVLGAIPAGVVIITLLPALIGQHYFSSACVAQAEGDSEKAITCYRRAMWFDRWRAEDVNAYAAIGELETLSVPSKDSPEKHISKARQFKEASQYDLATFELARAATWGGRPGFVARRESAGTRVEFGVALYRGGGIGAAVTQWEQALLEDPLQHHAVGFLIARGSYDIGRYQTALDAINDVLRATDDTPTRANAYSIAGDCYVKLGRDPEARNSYNRSLKEQMLVNFWAMSRLTGN